MDDEIWTAEAHAWDVVHLDRAGEVAFWTAEFDIEEEKLAALVDEVGPAVDDIVTALRRE